MDEFLIVTQEILKRFAVAWHYITVENDRNFHAHFKETKIDNIMVTNLKKLKPIKFQKFKSIFQ